MNKRFYFFALLFLFMAMPASAQRWFGVAVHGGASAVTFELEGDELDSEGIGSFGIGLLSESALGQRVRITGGLTYQKKGGKVSGFDGGGEEVVEVKLSYLDAPLAIKVLLLNGNIHPYIEAGGAVSLNLSAKIDEEDVKEDIKSMDWSFIAGLGVEIGVGERGVVVIGARMMGGLSNISDSEDADVRNGYVQGFAGYKIQFGG